MCFCCHGCYTGADTSKTITYAFSIVHSASRRFSMCSYMSCRQEFFHLSLVMETLKSLGLGVVFVCSFVCFWGFCSLVGWFWFFSIFWVFFLFSIVQIILRVIKKNQLLTLFCRTDTDLMEALFSQQLDKIH